jgi:hypothetical protein
MEMNGTPTPVHGRSIQLAVLAARSSSIAEAVAEARRRRDAPPATAAGRMTALRFEIAGT